MNDGVAFPEGLSRNFPVPRLYLLKPLCMLHDPQTCTTPCQSFQLLEAKSTMGRFQPQMETKSLFRLPSQIPTVMRMSQPGEETTVPVTANVSSLSQLPQASQLDGETPHFFSLVQRTRLSIGRRLSLLFPPKFCIPKERSYLFFFSDTWINKWQETSISFSALLSESKVTFS